MEFFQLMSDTFGCETDPEKPLPPKPEGVADGSKSDKKPVRVWKVDE